MKVKLSRYQDPRYSEEYENYSNIKKSLLKRFHEATLFETEKKLHKIHSFNYSCYYFYSENTQHEYWSIIESWIIETKAKKDYRDFFEKNFNNPKILKSKIPSVLQKLNNEEVDKKSFINFIRHFPILDNYIEDRNYNISIINNIIRLHIWHHNINLVLHFRNDFLIDFYSYDQDPDDHKDHLVYSMKGCFSSSSSLNKSYKIERLLSIFDKKIQDRKKYDLKSFEKFVDVEKQNKINILNEENHMNLVSIKL